ncbi:MAG: YegP family protein [Flavobacteriales bacterium]|nr:YegP family protein [Flavobacteriales bacterium]
MATFVIQKSTRGQFYYVFRGSNYEPVMTGEEHTTKQACQGSIDAVKRNAPLDDRYTRWQTGVAFYFNLQGGNGEKLGASEGYNSAQGRENGINVVKSEAPTATVLDRA